VRNHGSAEGDLAHLDTDAFAAFEDGATDEAAQGVDLELLAFLDALGFEEVAAEDADAVTGLLRFGAVGVQDAQTEGAVGSLDRTVEDAVGAEPVVAM